MSALSRISLLLEDRWLDARTRRAPIVGDRSTSVLMMSNQKQQGLSITIIPARARIIHDGKSERFA
jgi:hypothetical protein